MTKQLLMISLLLISINNITASSYRVTLQLLTFARNSGKVREVIKYAEEYIKITKPTIPCKIKSNLNAFGKD